MSGQRRSSRSTGRATKNLQVTTRAVQQAIPPRSRCFMTKSTRFGRPTGNPKERMASCAVPAEPPRSCFSRGLPFADTECMERHASNVAPLLLKLHPPSFAVADPASLTACRALLVFLTVFLPSATYTVSWLPGLVRATMRSRRPQCRSPTCDADQRPDGGAQVHLFELTRRAFNGVAKGLFT